MSTPAPEGPTTEARCETCGSNDPSKVNSGPPKDSGLLGMMIVPWQPYLCGDPFHGEAGASRACDCCGILASDQAVGWKFDAEGTDLCPECVKGLVCIPEQPAPPDTPEGPEQSAGEALFCEICGLSVRENALARAISGPEQSARRVAHERGVRIIEATQLAWKVRANLATDKLAIATKYIEDVLAVLQPRAISGPEQSARVDLTEKIAEARRRIRSTTNRSVREWWKGILCGLLWAAEQPAPSTPEGPEQSARRVDLATKLIAQLDTWISKSPRVLNGTEIVQMKATLRATRDFLARAISGPEQSARVAELEAALTEALEAMDGWSLSSKLSKDEYSAKAGKMLKASDKARRVLARAISGPEQGEAPPRVEGSYYVLADEAGNRLETFDPGEQVFLIRYGPDGRPNEKQDGAPFGVYPAHATTNVVPAPSSEQGEAEA